MDIERLGDMTTEQLERLIDRRIDAKLHSRRQLGSSRSVKEINDKIRSLRWTPPKGAPTNLELLREDRDR